VAVLGPQAQGFLERYATQLKTLAANAKLAEAYVRELLAPGNFEIHAISGRAKGLDSVRTKILVKGYGHPAMQLTDQLGVRVITYFETDVDRVVAALNDLLQVDPSRSPDKRSALGLREFGYRSVHLVARPRANQLGMEYQALAALRFEVQVRSILEHAWAEIEHEVVYKAGIDLPSEDRRRFSATAGTLEILEHEFAALRQQRWDLVTMYAGQAEVGQGLDSPLDAARMLGLLESIRPEGLSWRKAAEAGSPFPPRIDATCAFALRRTGIATVADLADWFGSNAVKIAVAAYAAADGKIPAQLSHLSVVVLAIAARDIEVAMAFLPELAGHPSVQAALGTDL
jgi:ppGpp synthetase/RelA/SpoT-type nucleotidyltranferase